VVFTVRVFISHSWSYSDHYDCLAEWIFEEAWKSNQAPVKFVDTSVPKNNPIHFAQNEQQLRQAIYARIGQSDVVVIPTGMYANYSNWIGKEIAGSQLLNKPILAVNPWGQERKSSVVGDAANKIVGWNKQSVVQGIWDVSPHG
jgi:NAD(P)H-dependent FMN reductase